MTLPPPVAPVLLIALDPFPTISQVEALFITRALELHRWNKTTTAKAIGIDRRTMHRMVERYGITKPAADLEGGDPLEASDEGRPDDDPAESILGCDTCSAPVTHVRCTQFAGEHYYCREHAEEQPDFGQPDATGWHHEWCTIGAFLNRKSSDT